MYKFPDDFDGKEFFGRTLEMICLNSNQVYLHFDGGMKICAEAPFTHGTPNASQGSHVVSVPPTNAALVELLDHNVIDVAVANSRSLTLRFDHGHSLTFTDITEQYESYRFLLGERSIVI